MSPSFPHPWRFFRSGGFDQVDLSSGADIAHLDELDQKLWVALACPTTGLTFDSATLGLIDVDRDGRIRVPEVISACKWVCSRLRVYDDLLKGSDELLLGSLDDSFPDGKALLGRIKDILSHIGKADASAISLADVQSFSAALAKMPFNGDGIITGSTTENEDVKAVIESIISTLGGEADRSGKMGVSQAKCDQFFKEAQAHVGWWGKGECESVGLQPLGEATQEAFDALMIVKPKIDDYFSRCRCVAFDDRALTALSHQVSDYKEFSDKSLSLDIPEMSKFPLAHIEAEQPLPLGGGLNPAWSGAMSQFKNLVLIPLLGEDTSLTERDWLELCASFGGFAAWRAARPESKVGSLGVERLKVILASSAQEAISSLIAQDKTLADEVHAVGEVEKLIRLHRDLAKLLVNFVSFKDFYDTTQKAIFQAGTLYMDARSCELCLDVQDVVKHSAMAALSGSYIAYCECERKTTGEKRLIAAVFSNGDSEYLMIGRNGIFYDRKGQDWDATITKIISNPISLREAFRSPYKKLIRMLEEMAAKRALAGEASSNSIVEGIAASAVNAEQQKPEPKKFELGAMGAVAAISFVMAGLGAMVTTLIGQTIGLLSVPFWKLSLGLGCLMLVVSCPFVVIAWLKLRKRNLGPLLDASGWAVNVRPGINVPFGSSLTKIASFPTNVNLSNIDEFRDRSSLLVFILKAIFVACFFYSLVKHLTA